MTNDSILNYFKAYMKIKSCSGYYAEKWLDRNSHKLTVEVSNVIDAEKELLNLKYFRK